MITLIIAGIDKSIGPGDIVGAFINEVGTASDEIGKIRIKRKEKQAEVEVKLSAAAKIIEIMNNNQIGGVKVKIYAQNPDDLIDKEIMDYYHKFKHLLALEFSEREAQYNLEMKYLTARERQARGRTILNLTGQEAGFTFDHLFLVKFKPVYPEQKISATEIKAGNTVIITANTSKGKQSITGRVVKRDDYFLTVSFSVQPPEFVYNSLDIRIDLFINKDKFNLMNSILESVKKPVNQIQQRKIDILLDRQKPLFNKQSIIIESETLNELQRKAVNKSLAAEDIYLIQGPPATGKTTTAVEIIKQSVQTGDKVLVTASSDYTVDKLSEFLLDEGINLLRFGYPINSDQQLINSTFAELIVKQDSYLKAQQLRKDLSKKYLTDQPNFNLETNLNILNQEDKKIIEQVKDLEKKAAQEILTEADVICTTNFAVGSKFLTDLNFDLSIIEEANQAIQPAALLAFLKAKKTILLGDQKELLPDIISKEAAKQGLASSLFDRLTNLYAENCLVKFKHQYRMNRKLMGFASLYFYDNQLRADESAAKITLADLDIKTSTDNAFTVQAMQANYPFVFLDTSEMKAAEHCLHENGLYYNPVEAEIILDLINQAVKSNLSAADIGVITPYLAQINLINQHNKFAQVEINQAAAFQGREKELIIYSAVRSNQSANLGLLKNLNQLNLALTRARRKIIFVGDSKTICQEEVYANLLIYTKKIGLYYKL